MTCPLPATLESLLAGGLEEAEAEALEQHVLECASCLAVLKSRSVTEDTLACLLREETETAAAAGTAVVALIGKLKRLRTPESEARPAPVGHEVNPPTQALANLNAVDPAVGGLSDFLAPAQAENELGRLGKYRVIKVLGHGGMGVVFRAEDAQLKRTVAIKAMLPTLAVSASARQRFSREAQAMAAVEHDHIVRVYQVDDDRGIPFLAMEFLKGETLDERLKRAPGLALAEVLRIGREIAEALAAAHATGLIHRDVKPANIWLEDRLPSLSKSVRGEGRVKLLDFGLVRAVAEEPGLTQQGAILGTPAFMSPEQARGDPVDERSDLFSLGVVLYRLSCGREPFRGKDSLSTLMEVTLREPTPPGNLDPVLPPEVSHLVMRLLQKDPGRRPASAAEVVGILQELENQHAGPHESGNATPRKVAPTPLGTRRVLLTAAGLALAVILVGLALQAVFRIETDKGDLVIQTDDPEFRFQVHKDGSVMLEDLKSKRNYTLKVRAHDDKTGAYELEVDDTVADLSFKTRVFTIKRGQTPALQAWFERKPAHAADRAAVDNARLKKIAGLPPPKQVEAVTAWFKECNPDFRGDLTPRIEGNVVTELRFLSHDVVDLTPLRALPELRRLECAGTPVKKGSLADLAPLKDLKLTELNCRDTNVSDLAPLKGLKLTYLDVSNTDVSDLEPLKGAPLLVLFAGCTKIVDLTPLRDMKLTILHCYRTPVTDLAPLKDVRLTALDIHGTQIADLAPLKDMKLVELDCHGTQIESLAPLKEMKLTGLNCGETQVSDLGPLMDMKLTVLWCDDTQVADLKPLKGMRLTSLRMSGTQVADLTPLKDMRLTDLWCQGAQVGDLLPLKGMPLQEIFCDFKAERDTPILRSFTTLEKINEKPAKEFWKEVEGQSP
jgi:serine/threonine protein kinase/Leucine-rich repeat (LRR) protein